MVEIVGQAVFLSTTKRLQLFIDYLVFLLDRNEVERRSEKTTRNLCLPCCYRLPLYAHINHQNKAESRLS